MLKAYAGTDCDLYAAESLEQARALCEEQMGEPCDDGYPRELTDAELDADQPEFDEDERPTGGKTSIRGSMYLAKHFFLDEPTGI